MGTCTRSAFPGRASRDRSLYVRLTVGTLIASSPQAQNSSCLYACGPLRKNTLLRLYEGELCRWNEPLRGRSHDALLVNSINEQLQIQHLRFTLSD
jgi:hypothetical protein